MFTKTAGFRHDSIPAAIAAVQQLGAANGFGVDQTEDAGAFTAANLARYRETYWSKYGDVYFAGDGARIDSDGDFWLLGRVDDVMNVSGHRISTIEVESALVDHREVAEAAVAARNDAMTGQAIVAFVTLKGGAPGSVEKLEELRNHVAEKIGPIAKPANIVFTPELPKTRSGKIMRRLLRDVAENRPLGDTTTLADPAVVDELRERGVKESSDDG